MPRRMQALPVKLIELIALMAFIAGCGGSGGSSGSGQGGGGTNDGYLFGERSGAGVYMEPAPPAYSFPSWSGTTPNIRIDQVIQSSSTVNPAGANINQATTQVVYGQVTGSNSGKQALVYSHTDKYYIQPLTGTSINIASNSTWIAPASAGQITALLVAQGYSAPDTMTSLPQVDGINVFAIATNSVNVAQFTFSEYQIPTANSGPLNIVPGPDSALWFTEYYGDQIGRISTSGSITEYPVPTGNSQPKGITAGPDGALWFTEANANQVGRITTSGRITEYTVPTQNAAPQNIAGGADGALWFTESQGNRIGRITTSGTITEYPVPTSGSAPWAIVAGPDGALWFTEFKGSNIGRINTSGQISEYALPNTIGYIPEAYQIIVGTDGALWFIGAPAGLGRVTTAGDITLWNISWNNIAIGPDQDMWSAGYTGSFGVVGQINEAQEISSFDIPAPAAPGEPGGIVTGPDGALWITDFSNYIVRFGPG